ncbi:MAG: 3-hydroxyacyl-CoA dehydrogenase NAD-binding domain-containing protein [Candidatus Nezhaarchaeota archaeon]|nr:3-hydroxyacyl-CoA dehydrogenase NAD-binding domain-containing protein [Candidatus Nezhaarchaeota archaeon]MCX8142369.1 3-hydroxyacyl-CoA dehydrogenase NAD-binding domain-containing protein [Candidatus Nezhaarchaeota archaeon]MDW8050658.1 3-hydroxyacyl-CoA dehydrogenase NAD-binding domain-containing protein [Nitrososphaerota archaeon]
MRVEDVKKVAIIGFGTMGSGIAQVFALAGYEVVARDVTRELLDRGLGLIRDGPFGLSKAVEKGRIKKEDADAALARIKTTTSLAEAVKGVDIVIEAVFENLDLKRQVFKEVDEVAPPHAIIASNTSTLSITALAAVTKRPEKVVGMHFFNPVPVMRLVEVVRGLATSDETVEVVRQLAIKLGKTPIVCKDVPGFVANRVAFPYLVEAMRLYEMGVASAQDIDAAMKLGYNFPMGPLELIDLIGLDVTLDVLEALYRETGDDKFFPPTVLRQMVRAGWLGRKTGRGFYSYK